MQKLIHVHGRDTAFHAAHVFMEAYDDAESDHDARLEAAKIAVTDEVDDVQA